VKACVTGATGFSVAHVTRLASELGRPVRVTYRDETRLSRLGDTEVEAAKANLGRRLVVGG
jgi:uncharacterized protein YbjT (DUF2867 family)